MELLTPQQTAKYLGISPRTLESMRLRGVGPTYTRVGRLVRYHKAALEAWVLSNQWTSTAEAKNGHAAPPARRDLVSSGTVTAADLWSASKNLEKEMPDRRRTPPPQMPGFTHCGSCGRKMTSIDINIAGFGSDGQPRSVGHCCIDQLESALLIGIPRDTPESGFSKVIQYLESRQVETERVKQVHSEGQLPYALHVFSRDLYRK